MANHYSLYTLLDASGERSTTKIYNGPITVGTITGFLTEFGQMRDAINAITLGTMEKEAWVGDATVLSTALPANAFAQRELKWLVRYRDTVTNKRYTLEIATADPTGRMVAGSDLANLSETQMAAFVTQFNSYARCPDSDANAVEIVDIRLVGRNI